MIKAQELRIGNKFIVHSDIVEVTDIDEDGIIGTTAYFDGQKGCCDCTESMAQPIALTPEILEKCGFEKADGYYSLHSGASSISIDDDLKTLIGANYGNDYALSHTIKYLHQLQNLFFVLTGHELNVQL